MLVLATRHERVIIDLDDKFSAGAARMAASTALFRRELDSSGRSTVAFDRTVRDTSPTIDKLSGRISILAKAAAVLGPGFVPITTAAVPALAGLSTQLGFAAAGAGVAVLAFNGVGDALGALNAYQLDPSAANFAKLQESMRGLGPAAREFVGFLDEIGPQLQSIREAAQEGLLPGVQEGLDSLLTRLPDVRRIVAEIADASGDLMAGAGAELAGSQWDDFFAFVESEARPALTTLGQTVGNLAGGIAELWMAMDPLSDDFTAGLLAASAGFERWAAGLSQTQGFEDFIAYVRKTGPQVMDTLGSLASALVDIGVAAAPLGGPVLAGLEAAAKTVSAIARSDLGTPIMTAVAAMSALSLATRGWAGLMGSGPVTGVKTMTADLRTMGKTGIVAWGQSAKEAERYAAASSRVRTSLSGIGRTAGLVAGLAVATTGLGDSMGVSNTASLALMGSFTGPWGAAIGGAVGLTMDLAHANDRLEAAMSAADAAMASGNVDRMRASLELLRRESESLAEIDPIGGIKAALSGDIGGALEQGPLGIGARGLMSLFDDAEGKAQELKQAIDDVGRGGVGELLTQGLGVTGRAFDVASMSVKAFSAEIARLNGVLEGRAGLRDYQAALDDLSKSLRENGKTLDITTRKGRANQEALDNIASTALTVAEKLKGMDRVDFLDKARSGFVRAAVAAGKTRAEAGRLADKLGLLNKPFVLDVSAPGMRKVSSAARDVLGDLFKLDKAKAQPKVDAPGMRRVSSAARDVMGDLFKLDKTKTKPKIDADEKTAQRKVKYIDQLLTGVDRQKTNPFIDAFNKPAVGKIGATNKLLNALDKDRANPVLDAINKATGVINSVGSQLRALDGSRATTTIETIHRNTVINKVQNQLDRGNPSEAGALWRNNVRTFDAGDVRDAHQPVIAPPSRVHRVWAEEETGGESYIPHANDWRRPRAVAIWEETGRLLGQQFADGGMRAADMAARQYARPVAASSPNVTVSAPSGPVEIRGTLQTKWGPAELVGTMTQVAERVVTDARDMDRVRAGAR